MYGVGVVVSLFPRPTREVMAQPLLRTFPIELTPPSDPPTPVVPRPLLTAILFGIVPVPYRHSWGLRQRRHSGLQRSTASVRPRCGPRSRRCCMRRCASSSAVAWCRARSGLACCWRCHGDDPLPRPPPPLQAYQVAISPLFPKGMITTCGASSGVSRPTPTSTWRTACTESTFLARPGGHRAGHDGRDRRRAGHAGQVRAARARARSRENEPVHRRAGTRVKGHCL